MSFESSGIARRLQYAAPKHDEHTANLNRFVDKRGRLLKTDGPDAQAEVEMTLGFRR